MLKPSTGSAHTYLSEGMHHVSVSGALLGPREIVCGVPQGSYSDPYSFWCM